MALSAAPALPRLLRPALRPRVLARFRGWLGPWGWLLVPLGAGLASRAVVLLVGYASLWLVPDNPSFEPADYQARVTVESWYNWDAAWYAAIALRGYTAAGPDAPSVAFWPLLPLLEWALAFGPLGWLVPGTPPEERVAWAGLLVVTAAFLVGLVLLYRLVRAVETPEVARRAVLLLAFAPGALFFTAPYPAALLLAGVAGCLLALHRGRWAWAGLAGGWAAAAQVPGCLLVVPFLWAYLARERRLDWAMLWGLLIPLGPAVWLASLWATVGDPLAPVHAADRFWAHTRAWPWETLWRGAVLALGSPSRHTLVAANLCATLALLGASGWALWRGPRPWGLWGLALAALYLSVPATEPLEGILRYGLTALPVWLVAARVTHHPVAEGALLGLLAAFQALLVALYVNRYWVA